MSEAGYMADCHNADRYDDENRPAKTHEVVCGGLVIFTGSRAECWSVRRQCGGWVQPYSGEME